MRSNRDYFEDFVTRSTYHSNAIEGSTLTRGETYALLWNDNSMTVKTTPREFYEAVNHKAAFALACGGLEEPLSERLIKDINRAINKDINDYAGYRTVGVVILGMDYVPPEANQVPQLMAVIGGIAALAVVCGLGVAFASGALSPTAQVATDDGSSSATVAQASDEDEALSPTDVAALAGTLSFDGKDVSVGEADVRVEVVGGRVMVTQTSSDDAATMLGSLCGASLTAAVVVAPEVTVTACASVSRA